MDCPHCNKEIEELTWEKMKQKVVEIRQYVAKYVTQDLIEKYGEVPTSGIKETAINGIMRNLK